MNLEAIGPAVSDLSCSFDIVHSSSIGIEGTHRRNETAVLHNPRSEGSLRELLSNEPGYGGRHDSPERLPLLVVSESHELDLQALQHHPARLCDEHARADDLH